MTDLHDIDLRAPAIDNPDHLTLPTSVEVLPGQAIRTSLLRVSWSKVALFGVSLFLFILALTGRFWLFDSTNFERHQK